MTAPAEPLCVLQTVVSNVLLQVCSAAVSDCSSGREDKRESVQGCAWRERETRVVGACVRGRARRERLRLALWPQRRRWRRLRRRRRVLRRRRRVLRRRDASCVALLWLALWLQRLRGQQPLRLPYRRLAQHFVRRLRSSRMVEGGAVLRLKLSCHQLRRLLWV